MVHQLIPKVVEITFCTLQRFIGKLIVLETFLLV